MKKNRILISILASSILLSSCSNLFESFLNDDEKAKTGDDSLTSTSATASYENDESTNTEIDKGLVVIKSSRPSYNQITYSASQKDYVVGSDSDVTNGTKVYLTSLDNPVTFKCLTNDSHSTVEWTAVQTYESVAQTTTSEKTYKDTADSSKTSKIKTTTVTSESLNQLNAPVDLTSSLVATADSKNQIQTIDLPYGTTVVTSKVTADDPQYNTTYTITLTKRRLVGTTEKTSELKSLSVIPTNTTNSDGTAAAVWDSAFTPDDRSYEVTVDEDCDELTFDFETGAGVEVVSPLVAANKYGTVLESDYTVLLSGGRTTYTIPVKDSDGSVKTYSVTVVKPEDGDTSLQSFDCSPSASYANGVKSTKAETFKTDMGVLYADIATATNGTFAYTASADNRVDVTVMSFIAVPTHKYTTVAYYVGDTCPDTSSDEWSTSYDKATELALHDNLAANKTYAKTAILEDDNTTTTLWMKTTSKAYKHSLTSETKTSDVTYHKAVITKAGTGNTKLTALYAMAEYMENQKGTTPIINKITTSDIAYDIGDGNINGTEVTTYCDKLTFYFRALNQDSMSLETAATKVSYSAVNTSYVTGGSENIGFTGYISTKSKNGTIALSTDTPMKDGLSYYTFSIGAVDSSEDKASLDLPDGTTTVIIYVNGTAIKTMTFVKPTTADVSLGSLGYDAEGKGTETEPWYIYVDNNTKYITLASETKQENAIITINTCQHIEDSNGATITPADFTYKTITQNTTAKTKWTIKIGETSDAKNLPVGKTKVQLNVSNTNITNPATYYIYIIKSSDTETRCKTLNVGGSQISDYDWNNYYSSTVTVSGTSSTTYTVEH